MSSCELLIEHRHLVITIIIITNTELVKWERFTVWLISKELAILKLSVKYLVATQHYLVRVGQGFWVYGIQGLFKSGIRYIAA